MRHDFGYFEEEQIGRPYDIKLLKRLYPFIKPYKLFLFLSICIVILISFIDVLVPYINKVAIDRYIVPIIKNDQHDNNRYLKIEVRSNQAIIDKYYDLFQVKDNIASISFNDLKKLEKSDIYKLRKDDINGVFLAALLILGISCLNFVFSFIQLMIMEYMGQKIMHDMRLKIFKHIQECSISFFVKNPVGRLVTRVTNDVQNMHEMFTSIFTFVIKDLFLLIGIIIALVIMNWKLALISLTIIPFVILVSMDFANRSRDVFRSLRLKLAEINSKFSESIEGIKVIQLFNNERENYQKFKTLNHENYLAAMRQINLFSVLMPILEMFGSIGIAVVIFYGGIGVIDQSISIGALVAFISYMKMFFRPVRDIAEKYNILQNAMASAERIFLILDNNESLKPIKLIDYCDKNISSINGVSGMKQCFYKDCCLPNLDKIQSIRFENVSFSYVKDEPVLQMINFEVKAGETIAIVGPTGSGKTSLINLIVRYYDPDTGRILLNNNDIREYSPSLIRSKIGLVTQDPFLFSKSIKDNIFISNKEVSSKEIDKVLKSSNCDFFIKKLPNQIDTMLTEKGSSLSSGERQLISIARAIAYNPDIIILDEATSYVDSNTEIKIQKAVANLMAKRTSIVIAHRLSTARNADKIIVLTYGRIIEIGSHDELMNKKGFYYRLTQDEYLGWS